MECTQCGAELEGDSRFCIRCAAPVPGAGAARIDEDDGGVDVDEDEDDSGEGDEADEVEADEVEADEHDRGVHAGARTPSASTPGLGAKISGIVAALALIVLGVLRLTDRPTMRIEVIETPDLGYGTGGSRAVIPRDAPPERAPTDSERTLAGTWVARVGFEAPRPVAMGATLVQIQAMRSGLTEATQRCIWLELYENLRGFQHECGVVGGEPSVLERSDPVSGRSSPLGVGFRWSFEGGSLSITYDEDMMTTSEGRTTRFRRTVLELPQGSPPFDVRQSFPEHSDVPPLSPRFEVFPGSYLGDSAPSP